MQKIAENKPHPSLLETIKKLSALGFKPQMLQSKKHNLKKINEIGRGKVIKILMELSEKGAVSRKRILSTSQPFPSHEEFINKIQGLKDAELADVLKRLSFLAQTKVYLFWTQNMKTNAIKN